MRTGVIIDGISRDLAHSLQVMAEFHLGYAELQFVWDKEVGDLSKNERTRARSLLDRHGIRVSCLSRHVFSSLTRDNRPGDKMHTVQMDGLKRVMEMAHEFESPLVRIFSPRRTATILWGRNGAEDWNVAHGAWDDVLQLIAPAVELARAEKLGLVIETGNGTVVNSCYTARLLIDQLDAKDVLTVLWDPANACWCHEEAWPNGYDTLRGGYLGHVHIKDVLVDTPRSTLEVRPIGEGQLADRFEPIANALRSDGYDGVVSYESVYHPGNGNYEDGFRQNMPAFARLFGH